MSDVPRYAAIGGGMYPKPDGGYVTHAVYAELEQKYLEESQRAARALQAHQEVERLLNKRIKELEAK